MSAAERSMDAPPRFGAVVTAMVTPFGPDGELDLEAAAVLARHLVDNGSDGLVVAGTTGEGPVLTDPERISLFRAVVEAVTVPVIASTGTNDTAHSVLMTREAAAAGAAGVLVVTPYYNRPSAAGLSAHFRAVAEASDLPVVLYDVPVRSGRRIGPDLTINLATEVANIVAVKDATGDVSGAARVVAEAPAGFQVYAGDDSLTLPFASVGGVGIVSVASHWAGPVFGQMLAAHRSGDVATAAALNRTLSSPTASSPPTSTRTRCRRRRPVGHSASPWASAGSRTHRLPSRSTIRPVPSSPGSHRSRRRGSQLPESRGPRRQGGASESGGGSGAGGGSGSGSGRRKSKSAGGSDPVVHASGSTVPKSAKSGTASKSTGPPSPGHGGQAVPPRSGVPPSRAVPPSQ